VEAHVIVAGGRPHLPAVHQGETLVADHLPVGGEGLQVWKLFRLEERLIGHAREQIDQGIVRRRESRVVSELARELQSHPTTEVHEARRGQQGEKNYQSRK
jgi:hypothetical protein